MATAETRAAATPSRAQALWFWFRIRCLTLARIAKNGLDSSIRRWPRASHAHSALLDAPVIGQCDSVLWNDGRSDEFALVAGKVHNLRLACRAFDGVELPAGAVLSFWQQLGRITQSKGYVLGREVREGCVVPTLGGGICQLSNALATAAVRANMQLLERHGHTSLIEQANSALPPDHVDATVLWKHIDLRIRTQVACRLEVRMDATHLRVRLRAIDSPADLSSAALPAKVIRLGKQRPQPTADQPVSRSCVTCNETACFRHQPSLAAMAKAQGTHAALLDGLTPELAEALRADAHDSARLVLPHAVTQGQRQQVAARLAPESWLISHVGWRDKLLAWQRAIWLRRNAHSAGQRQASILHVQGWQARRAAKKLFVTDVQLWVDQAYLPTLWRDGVLAGRRLRIWMPALPMGEILRRLDAAARQWPDEPSLADFRPEPALMDAELQALRMAETIVTPHHAVAQWAREHLRCSVVEQPWSRDCSSVQAVPPTSVRTIVLAASALPRKGFGELREALVALSAQAAERQESLRLGVLGSLPSDSGLPPSISVQVLGYQSDWLAQADVVTLPAHVEHNPRALLRALAAGVPVVATHACGIAGATHTRGLHLVDSGDVAALTTALRSALGWGEPQA